MIFLSYQHHRKLTRWYTTLRHCTSPGLLEDKPSKTLVLSCENVLMKTGNTQKQIVSETTNVLILFKRNTIVVVR